MPVVQGDNQLLSLLNSQWIDASGSISGLFSRRLPGCNLSGAADWGSVIAFPGLVNSHCHLEFDAYPTLANGPYEDFQEWAIYIHSQNGELIHAIESIPKLLRQELGAFKNLICGVTHVVDHSATPGAAQPCTPLTLIDGFRFIYSHDGKWARLQVLIPSFGKPVVVHLGEGITESNHQQSKRFLTANVFGNKIVGVHGISLNAEDLSALSALVWCPQSNLSLFGQTPSLKTSSQYAPVLFGTDSNLSASGHLYDHLRAAQKTKNATGQELLTALTATAHSAWNINPPSIDADFVVARKKTEDPFEAFVALNPEDILLVVKNGRIILMDDQVIIPMDKQFPSLATARVRIGNSKKRLALVTPNLLSKVENTAAAGRLNELDVSDLEQ